MKVYLIERERYLATTLHGVGAALTDGYRWNSLHTYMVYTADSRALAMLEVSVHIDLSEDLPTDRFYVEIEIPDDLTILELPIDELPDNWNAKPPILETQFIGDDFVKELKGAVLKVPSAIVPEEFNYLINPLHPDSKRIKVLSEKKVSIRFQTQAKIGSVLGGILDSRTLKTISALFKCINSRPLKTISTLFKCRNNSLFIV